MTVVNLRFPSTRPDGIVIMGAIEELRIMVQSHLDIRALAFVLQLGNQHKVAFFGGYQRDQDAAISALRLLKRNLQWKKATAFQRLT